MDEVIVRDMQVMAKCCPTCPFGPRGDRQVRAKVEARVLKTSQVCHHPRLHGKPETHLCRGARDYQIMLLHRMGVLAEPTDAAWSALRQKLGV
jgi:hypothetical protein